MANSHPAELLLPNDQFLYCQVISNTDNHEASDLSRSSPDTCSAAPEYSPGSIKREYTSPSEYSPSTNHSLGKRDSPTIECPLDSPDSMKQDLDSPSPAMMLWAAAAGGGDSDSNNLTSKHTGGNIKKRYNHLLDRNVYVLRDFMRGINYVHQLVNGTN